jgi:hypothetical protein
MEASATGKAPPVPTVGADASEAVAGSPKGYAAAGSKQQATSSVTAAATATATSGGAGAGVEDAVDAGYETATTVSENEKGDDDDDGEGTGSSRGSGKNGPKGRRGDADENDDTYDEDAEICSVSQTRAQKMQMKSLNHARKIAREIEHKTERYYNILR